MRRHNESWLICRRAGLRHNEGRRRADIELVVYRSDQGRLSGEMHHKAEGAQQHSERHSVGYNEKGADRPAWECPRLQGNGHDTASKSHGVLHPLIRNPQSVARAANGLNEFYIVAAIDFLTEDVNADIHGV